MAETKTDLESLLSSKEAVNEIREEADRVGFLVLNNTTVGSGLSYHNGRRKYHTGSRDVRRDYSGHLFWHSDGVAGKEMTVLHLPAEVSESVPQQHSQQRMP